MQTIRPAWKKAEFASGMCINGNVKYDSSGENPYIETVARFKVGEKIKLLWDQRSKHKWFYILDGKGWDLHTIAQVSISSENWFPKELGVVKVTDVFKIEMGKDYIHTAVGGHDGFDSFYLMPGYKGYEKKSEELAKKDGFESFEKMMYWFDKKYDLSKSKKFWVYWWVWL